MRYNPKPKGRKKWLFIVGIPLAVLLIAGRMTNTMPLSHSVKTSSDGDAELKTRVYSHSPAEIMAAARAIAGEQKTWFKAWRVIESDENALHVEVPVLMFTDDLVVTVSEAEGGTQLNVTSDSRVGQGDFGENRRHILQFLKALDEKLST